MFICKECKTEFEIKPEYCDCGNNEFEEVLNNQTQQLNNEQTIEKKEIVKQKPQAAAVFNAGVNNIPVQKKQTFSEQYPMLWHFFNSLEPISLSIFIICIILSFYVALFMWNPSTQNITETKTETEKQSLKQIPPIDTIWNNTIPQKAVTNINKQEVTTKSQNTVNQPKTIVQNKTIAKSKTQPVKINKISAPTSKPVKSQVNKVSSQQVQSNKKDQTTNKVTNQEQAKITAAQKKAEEEKKTAEEAQLKKMQAEQAKKAAELQAKQIEAQKKEYNNYKANLRNTVARKIDFTRVIGDGSCTVTFKIDQNGKLINRSFSKQSSNNTLNDAVYAAIMATPTFSAPPAGYKNEFLNLNIKFTNGNFEITLR